MNGYACPNCGKSLRWLFSFRYYHLRGYFRLPTLTCPACGQASRQIVAWKRAALAWPMTALAMCLFLFLCGRGSAMGDALYGWSPAAYGGFGGLAAGLLVGFGFRLGLALAPLEPGDERERSPRAWPIVLWVCVMIAVGVVSGKWLGVLIGVGIGAVVYVCLRQLGHE